MAQQEGVSLSDYRKQVEAWSFKSWADARDRLPTALLALKAPLWKAMVHGDEASAEELHRGLLQQRWAFVASEGGCALRRGRDGYMVEVKGVEAASRAQVCAVLRALEVEAEDAFIGA